MNEKNNARHKNIKAQRKTKINTKNNSRVRIQNTPSNERVEKNTSQRKNDNKKAKKYVSKKRIRRRNRFLAVFSIALILIGALTTLSLTVFFPIKTIKIENNKKYTDEQIASAIGVVKGDNLLLASESRANSALNETLPYIESVEFIKSFPFTLKVKVNEYKTFAQVKYGGSYIRISKNGKVMEITDKFIKKTPVVSGAEVDNKTISKNISFIGNENILQKLTEIINAFSTSKIGGVTLINFEDMNDIRVTYNNKIVMLLGSSSNLDKKLAHAKATLEIRGNNTETGTLNLSRIPSAKNEASFIPRDLEDSEIAGK